MAVDSALDPSALISRLPSYLPQSKTLKYAQDGLAALVHAAMSALDFRLVGIDESSPNHDLPGNVLPDEWNAHGPGHYTLLYKHDQSSLKFVLHVSKLGSRTMINAIASEVRTSRMLYPRTDGTNDRVIKLRRWMCLRKTSRLPRSIRTMPVHQTHPHSFMASSPRTALLTSSLVSN